MEHLEPSENRENPITSGPLLRPLIFFSLPLLGENLLQTLYNMVDSVVAGRFLGDWALAAVGSTSSLVYLITAFFMGISTGAGVKIAAAYGAEDRLRTRRTVANALWFGIAAGMVTMAVALVLLPHLLVWLRTPADIFDHTLTYMRIYLFSIPFIAVYNTGAFILRATGDSRRPLLLLALCSSLNLVLDIFFVAALGWGVAGIAWATFLAQMVSMVLILLILTRRGDLFPSDRQELKPDREILGGILRVGLPVAVQSSALSLVNVLFQSYVNIFGSTVVAGNSAGGRISNLIYMPCAALGTAAITFVSQNAGAGKYHRIPKITKACTLLSLASGVFLSLLVYLFRAPLLGIFTQDSRVLEYGVLHLFYIGLPSFIFTFQHIYGSVITGLGKSFSSMVLTMVNLCGVRMLWIFLMLQVWNDIRTVFLSYPVSWITGGLSMVIYYRYVSVRHIQPRAREELAALENGTDRE